MRLIVLSAASALAACDPGWNVALEIVEHVTASDGTTITLGPEQRQRCD